MKNISNSEAASIKNSRTTPKRISIIIVMAIVLAAGMFFYIPASNINNVLVKVVNNSYHKIPNLKFKHNNYEYDLDALTQDWNQNLIIEPDKEIALFQKENKIASTKVKKQNIFSKTITTEVLFIITHQAQLVVMQSHSTPLKFCKQWWKHKAQTLFDS